MGLRCRINRDQNGRIDRVERKGGEDSKLYKDALALTGDEQQALDIWSTAYTEGFISYYGAWTDAQYGTGAPVAEQEPSVDDVLKYMQRRTYPMGELTGSDWADVHDFMRQSNFTSTDALAERVRETMVVDGVLTLNNKTLRASRLYTEEEIDALLLSPVALSRAKRAFEGLLASSSGTTLKDKAEHYSEVATPNRYDYLPSDIPVGEKSVFGKNRFVPQSELDAAIERVAGGIKDRSAFNQAINTLESAYPNFVQRYQEDPNMASRVFDEYSSKTRIDRHEYNQGRPRRITSFRLPLLGLYTKLFDRGASKLRRAISRVLSASNDRFREGKLGSEIKAVEREAARMGIDIVGLSRVYRDSGSKDNVETLLVALDIYASGLSLGSRAGAEDLVSVMSRVFGEENTRAARRIPDNLLDKNNVYMETRENPVSVFNNTGLLKTGENLYVRADNRTPISELYELVAEMMKLDTRRFPPKAFPKSVFRRGSIDYNAVQNADTADLAASLRQYVLSLTDTENSEQMVLNRIAIGIAPTVHENPWHDFFKRLSEYQTLGNRRVNPSEINELYLITLANKAANTDLWRRALKYIDFKPDGSISLTVEDPAIAKQIGFMVEGRTRDILTRYVAESTDPRFNSMFYSRDASENMAGDAFFNELYKKYPAMLSEEKSDVQRMEDGTVRVEGTYKPFAKIGGEIYSKVGEYESGSVYQNINETGTAYNNEYMYPNRPAYTGGAVAERNLISDAFPIGSEKERLDAELVC